MSQRDEPRALIERLGSWLDRAMAGEGETVPAPPPDSDAAGPEVAPYQLIEEFTALRHESKLSTKAVRDAKDAVEGMAAALKEAIEQFKSVAPREEQASWNAGRPLAEALADLDEALRRSTKVIEAARKTIVDDARREVEAALDAAHEATRPRWYGFGRRVLRAYHERAKLVFEKHALESRHEFFQQLVEGHGLVIKRLERTMKAEQVEPVPCVGLPVDPAKMTVVDVVDLPDLAPGTVRDEVRRGYAWRGRVFRFAEVRAVRGGPGSPPT